MLTVKNIYLAIRRETRARGFPFGEIPANHAIYNARSILEVCKTRDDFREYWTTQCAAWQ